MTLNEYLNQDEPQRMPNVILKPNEYSIGTTIKIAGHNDITQVFIQSDEFNKAFPGMTNEYVVKGNEKRLWTQDGEGNPKSLSCFYLPDMPVYNKTDHSKIPTRRNCIIGISMNLCDSIRYNDNGKRCQCVTRHFNEKQ